MITFSVNRDINKVLSTSSLSEARPTTDLGRKWWSEVWIKALEDKTDDQVNIDAYGYACERNTEMAVGSKEVALLTVEELDMGQRGVADTVAFYLDTNVDTIAESSEAKTLVEEFLQVHEHLVIEEGVNLWKVMTLAKSMNMKMVDKLRDLITRYDIGELIEGVLKNQECTHALEGVMR